MSVIRIKTNATVAAVLPASEDQADYPSTFFEGGNEIRLYVNKEEKLDVLRQYVYMGLVEKNCKIQHVNAYLYAVLKGERELLEADWDSFGHKIGIQGEKIGPFNLVRVEDIPDGLPDGKLNAEVSAEDDAWLPLFLLGLYRVGRASETTYRTLLMESLIKQCKAIKSDWVSPVTATHKYFDVWGNDGNYLKIVACVDMFYNHFKKSIKATFRWGTIVSRFKDCAALATLGHVVKITGLTIEEVFTWVLQTEVAEELVKMMKPGQEIDNSASYMPYLIDMGISAKSPYSTIKNPSFHFWGQLVAALCRSKRALNARQPDEIDSMSISNASLLMAYALGSSPDIEQQFSTGDTYRKPPKEASYLVSEEPKSRSVVEWIAWYSDVDNKPTDDMLMMAKRVAGTISGPRDNSVGKWIKQTYG
ncbi:nucleocapsid protein [Sprivivirus cyprinus]|uniref:Nucleoprotein n=1 Tax=Spring viremia of carp virus TaxID=696863 RepID=Q91DS6_SVCV|nr:nucleocapsid protein [Sprivivirus cyprinus]AAK60421.1 nucleocapsid protein [Sprivivirus cyprinus]